MDEMKIGSKFTTNIISKLASLAIRKKFGYDVKLNLNEVKATVVDLSLIHISEPTRH